MPRHLWTIVHVFWLAKAHDSSVQIILLGRRRDGPTSSRSALFGQAIGEPCRFRGLSSSKSVVLQVTSKELSSILTFSLESLCCTRRRDCPDVNKNKSAQWLMVDRVHLRSFPKFELFRYHGNTLKKNHWIMLFLTDNYRISGPRSFDLRSWEWGQSVYGVIFFGTPEDQSEASWLSCPIWLAIIWRDLYAKYGYYRKPIDQRQIGLLSWVLKTIKILPIWQDRHDWMW